MATEKEQSFSSNGAGTTIHVQTDLTNFTKIDSQWIIGLNVKHRTISQLKALSYFQFSLYEAFSIVCSLF